MVKHRIFAGLLAATLVALACAPVRQVPLLPRPDTRFVIEAEMDSAIVAQVAEIFARALPNETGVCLALDVRDTVVPGLSLPAYTLRVTSVTEAVVTSATPFSVWYPRAGNGCPSDRQLGRGHSHPATPPYIPCTQSDQDARFMASDPRVLFSLIFCDDGRAEILWQDGRRYQTFWAAKPDSSESR